MNRPATRDLGPASTLPYCLVIMPFGTKPDPQTGQAIDFDRLYEKALRPAITSAGLFPYRDDALTHGGPVPKGIYEALMLSEYAIADLTLPNGNVLYELGIRHAVRPSSTLTITARPDAVPFDVRGLRMVRYVLDKQNRLTPGRGVKLKSDLETALHDLQKRVSETGYADSPLFQVIEDWRPTAPSSLRTDVFRDRVAYDTSVRDELLRCRRLALRGRRGEAIGHARVLRQRLGPLPKLEAAVTVDLLLTYRALELWGLMITFVEAMPGYVRDRALVQEQYAFALNRSAGRQRSGSEADSLRRLALTALEGLVEQGRGSSETWGLIGRVHKDWWRFARTPQSRARHLEEARSAYEHGFDLDPTDTYPGTNAAALLYLQGRPGYQVDLAELVTVVEFSARRLLALQKATYWMHAALLECAVLRDDHGSAEASLEAAATKVVEIWQPVTTRQNLEDIMDAQRQRGLSTEWLASLLARVGDLRPSSTR